MNKIDNNTILDKYKEISKLNIEEIYTKYNTSNSGLSNSEVNKKIKEYGKNIVIKEKNRSILYFIINAFKDEFILILLFLAIINFCLGDKLGSLVIILIAIVSALIRVCEDYSVYKFNKKLKSKIVSTCSVIRNNKEVTIKTEEVCVGDILVLNAGSIVAADSIIVDSKDLFVNESVFTGESIPVEKKETNKKECFYGYLPLANQVADGKIYIISCGTYVYHTHDHTFSRMQTDRDYDFSNDALCLSYSNDRFSLLKCAHQAFWVDQKSDSIRLLFELEKDELITSMSYDNNRMIWTSTNKGLGFFDLESQKYHRIRTRLFNGISYLIADGKGRLWICAQNHLYSYAVL